MDFERVRVTGETVRKFREVVTDDSAEVMRVNDAVMEPTMAEVLEQERVDKAMRGEEIIDGLDEEREEWTGGGRTGHVMRSASKLRTLIDQAKEDDDE